MNNFLFQMIAARASAGGNPALTEMLARMASGDGQLDLPELLSRSADGNPLLGALAKQMAQSRSMTASRSKPEVIEGERPLLLDGNPASEPESSGASTAQAMLFELQQLRERNDQLAAALGACCLCWGEDSQCRACRGRGRPGYALPEETLFRQLVLPAMHMLRNRRPKVNPPPSMPSPATQVTAQTGPEIS